MLMPSWSVTWPPKRCLIKTHCFQLLQIGPMDHYCDPVSEAMVPQVLQYICSTCTRAWCAADRQSINHGSESTKYVLGWNDCMWTDDFADGKRPIRQ